MWEPFYFHDAIQISRYLNQSFDLALQGEYGAYGFSASPSRSFCLAKMPGLFSVPHFFLFLILNVARYIAGCQGPNYLHEK